MRPRLAARLALFLIACAGPLLAVANPQEGINYRRISPELRQTQGLEVIELFWYACPYCDRLQPQIAPWRKKLAGDVRFRQQPAVVRPGWRLHAQAFYAAKRLGMLKRFHTAFFDAIHRQHRRFASEVDLEPLFADLGAAPAAFHRAFDSEQTLAQVAAAERLTHRCGVVGTPAFLVGGRYLTDARMAGGLPKLLPTVDFLIALARKESRPKTD